MNISTETEYWLFCCRIYQT